MIFLLRKIEVFLPMFISIENIYTQKTNLVPTYMIRTIMYSKY